MRRLHLWIGVLALTCSALGLAAGLVIERRLAPPPTPPGPFEDYERLVAQTFDLSGERRKELAKVAAGMAEQAKVSVRQRRHDALDPLKKAQKASTISEDDLKKYEKQVQKLHDKYIENVEKTLAAKVKDLNA